MKEKHGCVMGASNRAAPSHRQTVKSKKKTYYVIIERLMVQTKGFTISADSARRAEKEAMNLADDLCDPEDWEDLGDCYAMYPGGTTRLAAQDNQKNQD